MMTLLKAREVLGKTAECLTDEQLSLILIQFEEIAKLCLDAYEKEQFGKTFREMGISHD